MRIALDAMGGDYAPYETIKGAEEAVRELDVQVILVGNEQRIRPQLASNTGIEIVNATEVIEMTDHPAQAVRKKKDASVVSAVRLVREGRADAVVSAGSTGAAMAASLFGLGRLRGIDRPALVSLFPNQKGRTVILDVGANVDCKPQHLVEFAVMGSVYAARVLGVVKPRVGLLSIGEERTKGNEATLGAYEVLEGTSLNFIGNVEGRDLFSGEVDVVVCDGFVGNTVLKTAEGLATFINRFIRGRAEKSFLTKLSVLAAYPTLKEMQQEFDYNEYGGVPLLGVNGVSVIGHGSSRARAIKNAIKAARDAVNSGLVDSISTGIAELGKKGARTANA